MKTQHKEKKCQVHTKEAPTTVDCQVPGLCPPSRIGKTTLSSRKWGCSSHQAKGRSRKKKRRMITALSQGHNSTVATLTLSPEDGKMSSSRYVAFIRPKSTNRVMQRNCVICVTVQLQNEVTNILYRGYKLIYWQGTTRNTNMLLQTSEFD